MSGGKKGKVAKPGKGGVKLSLGDIMDKGGLSGSRAPAFGPSAALPGRPGLGMDVLPSAPTGEGGRRMPRDELGGGFGQDGRYGGKSPPFFTISTI